MRTVLALALALASLFPPGRPAANEAPLCVVATTRSAATVRCRARRPVPGGAER